MFRSVIVGVDESQGGRDARALAKDLVASDGSVLLARVFVHDPLTGRGTSPDFERRRSLELHTAARDEMRDEAELRCIDSQSVGRGLHELADGERADLLVLGSCHRSLIGRVVVGDDTSDALNGAPCAVAIAPFGYAERPAVLAIAPFGYAERPAVLREIGVAYNGSPESENALAVARGLAAEHGAKLSAFEAVSVPAYLTVPGAGTAIESLPTLVDHARARIAALENVEPHAAYGLAAEELAIYSASLDLLVVGSRGYGPIGRFVHGSTSRQLARSARCPLLVLTRAARAVRQTNLDHAGRSPAAAAVS